MRKSGWFLMLFAAFAAAPAWADAVTVKGEIIDSFCYITMAAKGPGHKECGQKCARKGMPVGIVEEGTGKIYTLMPNKDEESLPDSVINKMGETATVTGESYAEGGSNFLKVESAS